MKLRYPLLVCAIAAAPAQAAISLQTLTDNTEFTFGGYLRLDTFVTQTSDGKIAGDSIGRQFYVGSTIPVDPSGLADSGTTFDAHARSTRFNFGTQTKIDGHLLKTFLELDFMATPGGDERVSNSYTPRVRHAFFSYDEWLFGQTWTTFMNTAVLPETMDFLGVSDGTVFVRQAMVRYSSGGFQAALENPETTITPGTGGGRVNSDDALMPDLVLRYNFKGDWGSASVAGLARQLAYETRDGNNQKVIDETTFAGGVSASAKLMVGSKDNVKLMLNAGSGLGRYVALNAVNGAVLTSEGKLEAQNSVSGFAGYQHWWSEQWRSTLFVSGIQADNKPEYTGTGVTKSIYSGHLNLVYSPVPKLSLGVEYMYGQRELESGAKGDMSRFYFSAKYAL